MSKKTTKPKEYRLAGPSWELFAADCGTGTSRYIKDGLPTLAVEDPPYNIGQGYDSHHDKMRKDEFLNTFLVPRISRAYYALHPHGAYWIAMNDDNVAEVKILCEKIGFYLRKWVIWHYSFGQHNSKNFTASHTHWLYFTKHRTKYTFNKDDPKVRIPSNRALVYNDKRANPKGRLPDDVWVLRPQFVEPAPDELQDTWFFSRICGTFNAKAKTDDGTPIPNQMPVPMLERIIRLCSNPGDTVMDRFNGSGSTGEACLLTGRRYIGMDISGGCINYTHKRLTKVLDREQMVVSGDPDQLPLFPDKPEKKKGKKQK